jgi:HK97 family phage prohead protease
MTTLLGPLERYRTTTLTGRIGDELASFAAAVAVSIQTGREIVPGWSPARAEDVTLYCCEGDWLLWKSLIVDVCAVARIPVPMIDLLFPREPLIYPHPSKPDPRIETYFAAYREADFAAAEAAGRDPGDRVFVVFGLDRAIGFGGDGSMALLYRRFAGLSAVFVGAPTAFHENTWGSGEPWAGDFGPVFNLPGLCNNTAGVRDFYRVLHAVHAAERRSGPGPDDVAVEAPGTSSRKTLTAGAFLAMEPAHVLRAILDDSRSAEGQRIKEKARAYGISSGRLWHAAKQLDAAFAAVRQPETARSRPSVLQGYFAVFDEWVELNRWPEGNFMQRIRPGAFTRTIQESGDRMRVNLQHGKNPDFGDKALGQIVELTEDAFGARYSVELDDTPENWRLVVGLEAGLYGSSYSIVVVDEVFTKRPGRSAWNPKGLPERTIIEARLPDFGPVVSPLYPTTTAGIRE